MFYRNDERDDYWHMGAGTLIKSGKPDEGVLLSPGTMHCGTDGVPFCSEAWDAIGRYIYSALQGGAIMRGWMNDDKVMITCCNDGTRPVIFKIERIDISDEKTDSARYYCIIHASEEDARRKLQDAGAEDVQTRSVQLEEFFRMERKERDADWEKIFR